jgi:phospholipid/cholesterol/gamma-HCH transport system substrate-binding protein
MNYDKLLSIVTTKSYSAYFAEAGGLAAGNLVQVSGFKVGEVSSVALDGARVVVKFNVPNNIRLGDRTEAAVKLRSALGTKLLEVTPRGEGQLTGPIPLARTTPAYQLPDALGDLSGTISGLNTDQLSNSLAVLAHEFSDTPPAFKVAVQGVARLSQTLDERDKQLRTLLVNASKVTKVLAERSDEVVDLVANSNSLLAQLNTQSRALDQIATNLSAAAQQLKGFIGENRATLKPALDKLNGALTIVDNRKERLQKAIKGLDNYGLALGESISAGPFFKAYIVNLLPGQFIQPFIDSAFSDLGLDPATLLPSQLTEPLVGQPGTPPLPLPYPRTGQGGEPRLKLPDAITGKPGDLRYPLKEEPPAPPPGGPPPGPPLGPGPASPAPQPIEQPAPGEIPPVLGAPGPVVAPPRSPQPGSSTP